MIGTKLADRYEILSELGRGGNTDSSPPRILSLNDVLAS